MNERCSTPVAGTPLPVVLFLIFMILKLTNVIDWSWWWVTAPLWIPISIALAILTFIGIVMLILTVVSLIGGRKK